MRETTLCLLSGELIFNCRLDVRGGVAGTWSKGGVCGKGSEAGDGATCKDCEGTRGDEYGVEGPLAGCPCSACDETLLRCWELGLLAGLLADPLGGRLDGVLGGLLRGGDDDSPFVGVMLLSRFPSERLVIRVPDSEEVRGCVEVGRLSVYASCVESSERPEVRVPDMLSLLLDGCITSYVAS